MSVPSGIKKKDGKVVGHLNEQELEGVERSDKLARQFMKDQGIEHGYVVAFCHPEKRGDKKGMSAMVVGDSDMPFDDAVRMFGQLASAITQAVTSLCNETHRMHPDIPIEEIKARAGMIFLGSQMVGSDEVHSLSRSEEERKKANGE